MLRFLLVRIIPLYIFMVAMPANAETNNIREVNDTGSIAKAPAPADIGRGKAYFTTCAACHGLQGEGYPGMHAPGLTLQGADYLIRQLHNFRSFVRGGRQDFYGWQMNGRAIALPGDSAIRDVVAYIDTLPDIHAKDKIEGDSRNGEQLYNKHCISCHGKQAEGDAKLHAPPLAGLAAYYQLEQLIKYKAGIRGSHDEDVIGIPMRNAMNPITSEQQMRDIIKYISTVK